MKNTGLIISIISGLFGIISNLLIILTTKSMLDFLKDNLGTIFFIISGISLSIHFTLHYRDKQKQSISLLEKQQKETISSLEKKLDAKFTRRMDDFSHMIDERFKQLNH